MKRAPRRPPAASPAPAALTPLYQRHGVRGYYAARGADYRNPHEPVLARLLETAVRRGRLDLSHVLDLACGSGEVTLVLQRLGARRVAGVDPFTGAAYARRTGLTAEPVTFEAIAAGALAGRAYSLIVCSFALHLAERSRLPALAYQLSRLAPDLVVLTPHQRPALRPAWGWLMREERREERVRCRHYARAWAADDAV